MTNPRAVPRTPPPPEPNPVRKYRVLARRCVWGKKGSVIEKAFTPGVELCLIQAGTLERVPDAPKPQPPKAVEAEDRPLKSADKEG